MKILRINITPGLLWYLLLGLLVAYDYSYKAPYKTTFADGFLWPNDTVFTLTWFILLVLTSLSLIPLFKKHRIGLLGLVLFLAVILKPIIIPEVPRETAQEFFEKRAKELNHILTQYKKSGNHKMANRTLQKIGLEQLVVEGDTYIFTIDGRLDNGYGFVYDEDGKLPKSILSATTSFVPIREQWFQYSTT